MLYTAAVIAIFLAAGSANIGGFAIALTIVATVHSVLLRRQVWPTAAAPPPPPAVLGAAGWPPDPAVAAMLAGRARRDAARRLAAADPQMARELRIGRPDLPHTYDDGGLVDLNNAPPQAIAELCGIDPTVAGQIAAARNPDLPFAAVDDVLAVAEIPYPVPLLASVNRSSPSTLPVRLVAR